MFMDGKTFIAAGSGFPVESGTKAKGKGAKETRRNTNRRLNGRRLWNG